MPTWPIFLFSSVWDKIVFLSLDPFLCGWLGKGVLKCIISFPAHRHRPSPSSEPKGPAQDGGCRPRTAAGAAPGDSWEFNNRTLLSFGVRMHPPLPPVSVFLPSPLSLTSWENREGKEHSRRGIQVVWAQQLMFQKPLGFSPCLGRVTRCPSLPGTVLVLASWKIQQFWANKEVGDPTGEFLTVQRGRKPEMVPMPRKGEDR